MFGIKSPFKKKDPFADLSLDDSSGSDPLGNTAALDHGGPAPGSDPFASSPDPLAGTGSDPLSADPFASTGDMSQGNDFSVAPAQPQLPQGLQNQSPLSQTDATHIESQGFGTAGNKDLELIASKLDVIKALLETLSHRVSTIEQRLELNQKKGW